MPVSAAERSLIAKTAVRTRLAREDPREMTAAARKAAMDRFYNQTDPVLPEAERQRRAAQLRSAHASRMRQAQLTAARKKRELEDQADDAAAELAALDVRDAE